MATTSVTESSAITTGDRSTERAAFTPGPWKAGCHTDAKSPCNCHSILSQTCMGAVAIVLEDNGLAITDGGNDCPDASEAVANAHLIAAAPEMYAALELVERELGIFNARNGYPTIQKAIAAASAARSKAEGR